MGGIFKDVFINTNMPEVYFYLGFSLIGDVLPSRGPMSGIHASLINSKRDSIFVIACDMPFVRKEVISLISRRHEESTEAIDATIPLYKGEPQPLLGVYCKSVVPYLEEGILSDKTSMKRFLHKIKTNFIDESDIMTVDPDGRSFVNINTMEDYVSATGSSAIYSDSEQ